MERNTQSQVDRQLESVLGHDDLPWVAKTRPTILNNPFQGVSAGKNPIILAVHPARLQLACLLIEKNVKFARAGHVI
jgi:hypothetical protein